MCQLSRLKDFSAVKPARFYPLPSFYTPDVASRALSGSKNNGENFCMLIVSPPLPSSSPGVSQRGADRGQASRAAAGRAAGSDSEETGRPVTRRCRADSPLNPSCSVIGLMWTNSNNVWVLCVVLLRVQRVRSAGWARSSIGRASPCTPSPSTSSPPCCRTTPTWPTGWPSAP